MRTESGRVRRSRRSRFGAVVLIAAGLALAPSTPTFAHTRSDLVQDDSYTVRVVIAERPSGPGAGGNQLPGTGLHVDLSALAVVGSAVLSAGVILASARRRSARAGDE